MLALALMGLSLLLRAASWHEVLRAALPDIPLAWPPVIRATMIGVMASAIFPGRLGEPHADARAHPPSSRLLAPAAADRRRNRLLADPHQPARAGDSRHRHLHEPPTPATTRLGPRDRSRRAAARLPARALRSPPAAPRPALALDAHRARRRRARAAACASRGRGSPPSPTPATGSPPCSCSCSRGRCSGSPATRSSARSASSPTAASPPPPRSCSRSTSPPFCPPTPSNVGVFQAACLVVLAAYGVGAGPALAYGIILQAVEVLTALGLGIPACSARE